jgi:phenylpropionate dioxygenase-like ring-hydroxylating dioxygenase large terminal subunit
MVMDAALVTAVKERCRIEADRSSYPAGFPALPPVPSARYADPDFAHLEMQGVFSTSWLFVAHTDELRHHGDFIAVSHLPKPILLVRGDDDVVRAFYNTCSHRGSALVSEPTGNTGRRLTCPYHAWVYSLTGRLVGYPEPANFLDLDRDCHGLTSVRCETWGPLVFVNLDAAAPGLAEYLGTVGVDLSELADLDGRLHLVHRTVRDVPVNWKIPVDANIETYHVNVVHRDSAAKALRQAATGIQLLGNGHSRMLIRLHDGIDLGPDLPFPALFSGVGDLPLSGTFSYHVFPNLSIVFGGPGFLFLITNWPSGPASSTYQVHWCSSLEPGEDSRQLNDKHVRFTSSVLFEDLAVLPGIQISLSSGTLDSIRLSYQERRIYHLHEAIDRAIGVERVPDGLSVPQVLGPYVEE